MVDRGHVHHSIMTNVTRQRLGLGFGDRDLDREGRGLGPGVDSCGPVNATDAIRR